MLTAVSGYYNGQQIVPDEDIPLYNGQKVIITVLGTIVETPRKKINLGKYMNRGKRLFSNDAGEYIKELRANDRL